ncbi:MAG: hypothetical protein ACLT8E_04360 [Akkermansia sp.]
MDDPPTATEPSSCMKGACSWTRLDVIARAEGMCVTVRTPEGACAPVQSRLAAVPGIILRHPQGNTVHIVPPATLRGKSWRSTPARGRTSDGWRDPAGRSNGPRSRVLSRRTTGTEWAEKGPVIQADGPGIRRLHCRQPVASPSAGQVFGAGSQRAETPFRMLCGAAPQQRINNARADTGAAAHAQEVGYVAKEFSMRHQLPRGRTWIASPRLRRGRKEPQEPSVPWRIHLTSMNAPPRTCPAAGKRLSMACPPPSRTSSFWTMLRADPWPSGLPRRASTLAEKSISSPHASWTVSTTCSS